MTQELSVFVVGELEQLAGFGVGGEYDLDGTWVGGGEYAGFGVGLTYAWMG